MKRNITWICIAIAAFVGNGVAQAQQTGNPRNEELKTEPKSRKAWEVGVGGSIINWNRISFSDFNAQPTNYFHHMKVNHIMGGPNLYVAREIIPWIYVDLQGQMGLAESTGKPDGSNSHDLMYMAGLGVQFRFTPLFESKYVEPYLRVGINYLHKNFEANYAGKFVGDPTGLASWEVTDTWNPNGHKKDKNNMIPLSFGVGFNAWMSNRFGLGIQGEYLMPVQKDLPRFFAASVRLLLRFGGKDKRPVPVVRKVEVEVPVERIVEKVVEVPVDANAEMQHTLCRLLDNVHFDFDRDLIAEDSEALLDEIANALKEHSDSKWLITGYSDARGAQSYNIDLSKRRAKMVYDALVKRGVSAANLKWRGVGEAVSVIPASGSDELRRGDRKVLLEMVDNEAYWNALK